MQHAVAGFRRYGFHTLRHAAERHIPPTPGTLRHQRHLGLGSAFQQQFGARQVIGEDHFIIHGHQPIAHANSRRRRRAVPRDGSHQHLAALGRKPEAHTALPKPAFAGKLRFFRRHITAERVKMAENRVEACAQQPIPALIANGW